MGNASSGGGSGNRLLPPPSDPVMVAGILPRNVDEALATASRNAPVSIANSAVSRTPYSYYEGLYGDTATQNKLQPRASVTTTGAPVTEYPHERGWSIFYQSVNSKYNYPLGTKYFNKLASFCHAEVKYIMEQAYSATPELRCKLMMSLADKIDSVKFDESLLREINSFQETLSAQEHGEEVLIRHKLTTLYLAAEYVIEGGKGYISFYDEAMRDYQKYSTKELAQREEKIMNYFPIHDAMGEC